MSFDSLLNKTCTIQTATSAQDATSLEFIQTWIDAYLLVPCRLTQAKGGKKVTRNDQVYDVTHKCFISYRTDINWNNTRIVVDSITYEILLVGDGGGAGHHLELSLNRVR